MKKFLIELDLLNDVVSLNGFSDYNDNSFFLINSSIENNNEDPKKLFESDFAEYCRNLRNEFLISTFDTKTKKVQVATDFLGKNVVYFINTIGFIGISNDFWKLVSVIKSRNIDFNIDVDFVKQTTVHNVSFSNSTIVDNIKTLPPSSYIEIENNKIEVKKYDDIVFKENNKLTLDDIVDKTHSLFTDFFKKVSDKYKGESIGLGLSGGLDSRIVASMAIDQNIQLETFCIGEKNSFSFLKTYGYYLSNIMRNKLNIKNYKFIEYNSDSYNEKLFNDIFLFPCKSSNINICNINELPDFDVMLNGEHGGVFFGEFDFKEICHFDNETLSNYLVEFLSFTKKSEMIFTDKEKNKCLSDVNHIISGYGDVDRFNAFYRFFFEVYGSKSKGGFFESIYMKKIRLTPFLDRDFFDFFLTWPTYMRFSRIVQYRFLEKYFNDLSKISDESLDGPILFRKDKPLNWMVRFLYALRAKVFGSSLNIKKWILRDKVNYEFYSSIIDSNKSFVLEYFPSFDYKVYFKENPRASMNLAKLFLVKNVIENTNCTDVEIKKYINEYYK